MKCSNQLSVTMPQGEYRLLSGLLNSDMWKFQSKIVSTQVILPQVTQTRTQEKFTKLSIKGAEVPYWTTSSSSGKNVGPTAKTRNGTTLRGQKWPVTKVSIHLVTNSGQRRVHIPSYNVMKVEKEAQGFLTLCLFVYSISVPSGWCKSAHKHLLTVKAIMWLSLPTFMWTEWPND